MSGGVRSRPINDIASRRSIDPDRIWSFDVLGPLVVAGPGGPVSIPLGRERAVLAQLIARVDRPVGVDVLIDGLWGANVPASAERTLHVHVARLRSRLEPGRAARQNGVIVTTGRGYMLAVGADAVDAGRFEALVARAAHDGVDASGLRLGLDSWRGHAYQGFDDVVMCAEEGRRLDALRLVALELRIDADVANCPDATLVGELETLVNEHPFRERFWEQLMLCLYRTGRQTDALAAFKRARRVLIEEMGVEPGPGLRHLEAAILDHDPGLLSTRRPPSPRRLPLALDSPPSSFLGRGAELDALLAWWSACRHGSGGFVSVLGPEGAGKSRLAAEVARRAHDEGGVVLYARCDHAQAGPRPLLDAALRSQGSSIEEVSPGSDGLPVAMAQHLAAWRADRPVLLVLDDLHLADSETLTAVADLAQWCASMPVMIVGVFLADDEAASVDDRHVVLGGLDRQAVTAICEMYRRDGWTAEDVTRVLAVSGGLPLQVHREAAAVTERAVVDQLGSDVERMNTARRAAAASRVAATDAVLTLRRLVEQRRRHDDRWATGTDDANPYRGLDRYEERDVGMFFGRDRLIAELVVRLASNDLIAVVGPSGSGKSSVVRAGLLAAVARGDLPQSQAWSRVIITPGGDPRAALQRASAADPAGTGRLIVVDQFEELYTLGHDADVRGEFLDELDRLTGLPGTKVVVVVRSDQLGRLAEHPSCAARLTDATILVGSMSGAEIRQVVEGPAASIGVAVEPALVDHVVADAAGEPGVLPLVSTALAATWERRTDDALTVVGYERAGRVSGAVARLAEDVWGAMPDATRDAARRILLRLVRFDDAAGVETRLRARPQDLAPATDDAATDALARMVERRLMVLDAGTVQITHEALVRAWPRLAGWLADDVDGRRLHHHLAGAARSWADGGEDDADLLVGARLAATTEWVSGGHERDVNDLERRFVAASVALADRQLDAARTETLRQRRTNRRLRVLAAGTAVLLVVAMVTGMLAVRQADRADTAAAEASTEAERADAAAWSADAERLGALAGLETDLDHSLLLAAQAYSMADTTSTRGALLRAVQQSPQAVAVVRSESARLLALELSPDGAMLAVNENEGGTTLYEAATGRNLGHFSSINALGALAWTPDGSAFATLDVGAGHDDGDPTRFAVDVVVVDAATLTERARYTGRDALASDVAFSSDGAVLVAAPAEDGAGGPPQLTVWDVARPGPPRQTIDLPDAALRPEDAVSFDATGGLVAVSIADATVLIDVETGERTRTFEGSGGLFSADGRTLAVNSGPGSFPLSLDLIDVATGARRSLESPHTERIIHRDFSRDGTMIATVADDRLVRVWDTATGGELDTLSGHTGRILASAFAPDGATLFSTGLDRAIIAWDLAGRGGIEREIVAASHVPDYYAETFAVTSDGSTVVAFDYSTERLNGVNLSPGRPSDAVDTGHGVVFTIVPSGGSTVITGGDDGAMRRWEMETGDLLATREPADPDTSLMPLAITPDGSTLYVQIGDFTIGAFDPVTLHPIDHEPVDVGAGIITAAVSPDGSALAVATYGPPTVAIVDLATGRQRSVDVPGEVVSLAFSPDGALLGGGDVDGRLLRIDVEEAAVIGQPVVGHDGVVVSLAFSADGSLLSSGSTDGNVGLWEPSDGRLIGFVQPGPPNQIVSSAWRSDGHTLLLMYGNGSVFTFDTRVSSWSDYACRTAGRQLSPSEWTEALPDRPYDPACP